MLRSLCVVRRGILPLTALVLAFVLGHAVPAHAQAASASIAGTIADAQGGVLPGVTITVQNAESGTVRTSVTEADGKYRVAGLNPGRYNLTAELPGFQTVAVKDIVLVVGQEYSRDFQLALSTVQESVTVTGEAPIVQATKTEVAAVVTQDQIEMLPAPDRGALSLSILLPGDFRRSENANFARDRERTTSGALDNVAPSIGIDAARVRRPRASVLVTKTNLSSSRSCLTTKLSFFT